MLAFLWRALPVVLLAFGAVLFAVLLRGIAGGLRCAAPRVPEKASVGLAAALFVGVLVGFGFFVATRISEEASALAEQLPRSAASCSGLPAPSSPSPCSWRCSRSSRRCT